MTDPIQDRENANFLACFAMAMQNGHTREEAEKCNAGSLNCKYCYFATEPPAVGIEDRIDFYSDKEVETWLKEMEKTEQSRVPSCPFHYRQVLRDYLRRQSLKDLEDV